MVYVNADIAKTERVFPMQGRRDYLRYDMNENAEGLPNETVEAVKQEITGQMLAAYPEPDAFRAKYAAFIGVDRDNIMATNGSDMAIRYALETFGERGRDVVTVSPTFGMYAVNCSLLGLRHKPVAYNDDLTFNAYTLLNAIDSNTSVVVILNPNNPVGDAFTAEDMERIVRRARQYNALVIIDEAYHYFYDKTFLPLVTSYDNVILLRTFSKLFALAALRLGVIVGNKALIHYLNNARLTFDVNSVALLFGERLLDNPAIASNLLEAEEEGKAYLDKQLTELGYEHIVCKGNFVLIVPKTSARLMEERLRQERHILVHTFGGGILERYIRVSVGSPSYMKKFCEAFFALDRAEA